MQLSSSGKQRANVVKPAWFGRQLAVTLMGGESVRGELTEVSENYIILNTKVGEKLLMVHAIIAVWPVDQSSET